MFGYGTHHVDPSQRHQLQHHHSLLRYRNALAMIEWLCNAFGFETHPAHADGCIVHHARLTFGNTGSCSVPPWYFGSYDHGKPRRSESMSASAPMTDLFTTPKQIDNIRVGIGGWVYAPWRDNFYPQGLVQKRELEYASRHVTAIEVNGTWYGAQKPSTYARWRDETPDGFVFSAKAPQRITMSRTLAKTGGQIDDFLGDIATLGAKLGPLVWQFEKGLEINRDAFGAFLALLPQRIADLELRHVLDVRDRGFVDADYIALVRRHGMATVFTDSTDYPSFADVTADFVYARLMRSRSDVPNGYPDDELDRWARHANAWAKGEDAANLPHLSSLRAEHRERDVFVYFIGSAKERNPAAAMALLEKLGAN